MRRFLLPLLLWAFCLCGFSQTAAYDSLKNRLPKENVRQYIGQELYLNYMREEHQKFGYPGFFQNYTQTQPYKANRHFNSDYASLVGRTFIVKDVVTNTAGNQFLKLQDKKNKEIIYYQYGNLFRFIVLGHAAKMKQKYTGKEFVVRGRNWISLNAPMENLKNGATVSNFEAGAVWKCVDVTYTNQYELSLILQNKKKEQIPLMAEKAENEYWIFTKEKADIYQQEFGEKHWNMILDGVIQEGMTERMCLMSWGKPEKVNKLKNELQYVYDNDFLYFKDGKLTSIKDKK